MLRLALLLLYLIASSSVPSETTKGGSGWDPLGLSSTPPQHDGGGSVTPLGFNSPPPETDGGSGWDPLG